MDEFVNSHYPLEILGYFDYTPQKPLWIFPSLSNTPWKYEMFPFNPSEISMDGFTFVTTPLEIWDCPQKFPLRDTKSIQVNFYFKVAQILYTDNKY